ncbi:unnamed protein product [marine sediment metagenome]|uniref:PAS domain-containing protein n=1 Tax=marine sediment metagenome TaxID=412755 RepID=X1CR21_9ZZZZ
MKTFPDLVVILDLEGNIINISRNIQNFYATKSIEDFIGKNIIDFVVSEDREPFKEDLEKAINQGFLKMVEYHFSGANDSRFIGELSLSLIKNKKNEPNFFIGIIRDITNQKGIERELRENKQMFQLVIDNIPQLISWKDINSTYLGCNTNFARVAGLSTPDEITNKTDYELPWKVSEAESFFEIDQLVMNTNKPEYHIIGIFAAFTCILTFIVPITIPATQGYINLGDIGVMISGLLFGPIIGGIAGGFGSALADLFIAPIYAIPTLIIKGLEGFLVGFIANPKNIT